MSDTGPGFVNVTPDIKVYSNSKGIVQILKSAEVQKFLESRAELVEQRAKATAPVKSGEYRDSITTGVEERRDRKVARVYADSPQSLAVEASRGVLAKALKYSRRS